MNTRHALLLIAVIAILVAGCRTINGPNVQSGSLRVDVWLDDSTGNPIPEPYQGITIGIENTNFQALADSLGEVYFTDVPAGQYNIVASKPGFGLMKTCDLLIEGPATSYTRFGLGAVSSATVVLDSVSVIDSAGFIHLYASTNGKGVIYFIDLDSNVLPSDAHRYYHVAYPKDNPGPGWSATAGARASNYAGISPGMKLYVSAAAFNVWPTNYAEGESDHFTSTGPKSNVISFVVH